MQPFATHKGRIAILDRNDVDTDRIIPARYLSLVTRSGYGELLFKDVRGADFPLDNPKAAGASVLVVGHNFGCGSSREHAVWAIQQAGFKVVIARKDSNAPGFSDIFRQNAANNGLLLIELEPGAHEALTALGQGAEVSVNLEKQEISFEEKSLHFDIQPSLKAALLSGLDLIGTTLLYENKIAEHERKRGPWIPPREK